MTNPPGYRSVHQDSAHVRYYDRPFWSPYSAKSLDWALEQRLLDRVFARDLPAFPRVALDFACGTGRILRYLEGRVEQTLGIDVSAEMLALARTRCRRSRLVECDVTISAPADLPTPVDLVTAFRFFLNAEPDLRRAALDWMRAVVAPEGALVANFHLNPASLRGTYLRARWGGHRYVPMLAPAEAADLLGGAGFRVTACYGYEFLPYRREGDRLVARRARSRIETALLDRPSLARFGGSFLLVARRG